MSSRRFQLWNENRAKDSRDPCKKPKFIESFGVVSLVVFTMVWQSVGREATQLTIFISIFLFCKLWSKRWFDVFGYGVETFIIKKNAILLLFQAAYIFSSGWCIVVSMHNLCQPPKWVVGRSLWPMAIYLILTAIITSIILPIVFRTLIGRLCFILV